MRRRGFSFIEVLFAIALLAAAASIVTVTMPIANNARSKADLLGKATNLAQKQLEAMRSVGYPNTTPTQLAAFGLIDNASTVEANTYSFTSVDTAHLDSPAAVLPQGIGRVRVEQIHMDMRRLTVMLSWNERGQTRTYSVATIVANL
jgi:prepilin-type N-terminal cleavage/methylation domain-containing protein